MFTSITEIYCCNNPCHTLQQFKKSDLVTFTNSRSLVELIQIFTKQMTNQTHPIHHEEDRKTLQSLILLIIEIILEFKDREMYDTLSKRFIKADIFSPLIKTICLHSLNLNHMEFKSVARIFELCACHTEGIMIL